MHTYTFEAIGTHWVIDINYSLSEPEFTQVKEEIRQRIEVFDKTYSRFRDDSLITKMAKSVGTYPLTPEGRELLQLYKKLYDVTDGSMTPMIGSVLEDAGYDSSYSLQPKTLHTPPAWDDVIELNGDSLRVNQPALLDLGAIGKGMLIDMVARFLNGKHMTSFCIDAGGDIYYQNAGAGLLRVGLEHPEHSDQVIGVASILNQSIAASAGNRRKWKEFHHIIDPKTLKPVTTLLASWIIADRAALADALATAVFFVQPEVLRNHFSFSYLLLLPDYTVKKSDDFPGELYYT